MSTDQGRRTIVSDGPLMDAADGENKLIGGDSFTARTPNPSWLKDRNEIYETIKARRAVEMEAKIPVEISVTMPDGTVLAHDKEEKPFMAYQTTPFNVAVRISQGLADSSIVARVTYQKHADDYVPAQDGVGAADTVLDAMEDLDLDGNGGDDDGEESSGLKPELWDMTRPLVGPVQKMEFLKFDDDQDAKTVFWHSSAHMMGEALEHLFGSKLTIGPPLKAGFYYDSYMGQDSIKDDDCE